MHPPGLLNKATFIFSFLAFLSTTSHAQSISLREAIDRALLNNYNLQIQQTDTAIAQEEITIADAGYDPTISLSANTGETKNPIASSSLTGATRLTTDSDSYSASVSKTFARTGTETSLSTRVNSTETNSSNATLNPDVTSEVGISLTQPLLQGRGIINLAPLARARTRGRIAYLQLQQSILDTVQITENAYWLLATEQQLLDLRQSSYELAETLLDETRQRMELGLATEADVLQAQAELASQNEAIIASRQAIEDASDQLAQIMGALQVDTVASLEPQALPKEMPTLPEYALTLKEALAINESSRILEEEVSLRKIDASVTRNARLPELDLNLAGAYLGRDRKIYDSYDSTAERKAYEWSAGVTLTFPWGLRGERAEHRVALKRVSRAEKAWEQVRQDIVREVRQAWRALKMTMERYHSAQATLKFTHEAYERERARYAEGLASFRDTLEAQRDLDTARLRALESHLEVLQARTSLERLDGDLLRRHGYAWESLEAEIPHYESYELMR